MKKKDNNSFIKNKWLFYIASGFLIIAILLDSFTPSLSNVHLDQLIEVSALIFIISIYYISVKHNTIINIIYIFIMFVCVVIVIIASAFLLV